MTYGRTSRLSCTYLLLEKTAARPLLITYVTTSLRGFRVNWEQQRQRRFVSPRFDPQRSLVPTYGSGR
jgi:hypothetical protein